MKSKRILLTAVLALLMVSVFGTASKAGGSFGDLGFLLDGKFSTAIFVDNKNVLDVFERVRDEFGDIRNVLAELDRKFGSEAATIELTDENFPSDILDQLRFDVLALRKIPGFAGTDVKVAYAPDPFITFSTTFTNTSANPIAIDYDFLLPTLPVVGATEVVSQLSVDLIDTNGDGAASITLNPFDDAIQEVGFLEGGIFGTFTDPDLGVGTAIDTLGQTLFAPAISAGPEADTAFDALTLRGRFTLSAGDSVTVTGLGGLVEAGGFLPTLASFNFDKFPPIAVPEPSSALLLLGLAAIQAGRRSRRA